MYKIVMIIPPFSGEGICTISSYCRRPFDYVMFNNVAAILREKYIVSIYDFDLAGIMLTQDYMDTVKEAIIQIIYTTEKHMDKIVQKYINLVACKSIVIGPGSKKLDNITAFRVVGEPEFSILDIIDRVLSSTDDLSNKLYQITEFGDISLLPPGIHNNLEDLSTRGGYPSVVFARGCSNACLFCRSNDYYVPGKRCYRRRPIEHVVAEIKTLIDKGQSLVHLECETIEPSIPKDEIWKYLKEIEKLKIRYSTFCNILPLSDKEFVMELKNSGCQYVFIGIENSNDSILRQMHKPHSVLDIQKAIENLNNAGIQFGIGFLPFNPYCTAKTVLKDISFLKEIIYSQLSHPWNVCCFMNVCIMDESYTFDVQVSNIYFQFKRIYDDQVLPQITRWEKELHVFPERFCPQTINFNYVELFNDLIKICNEHIYKGTCIKPVSKDDAGFLYELMNCPSVLKALNEVSTVQQDWVEAIHEWDSDEDEEDYIVFVDKIPIGWLGINGLLDEDKKVYLKMAAFLPDYQGQGFGSFAIRELMYNLMHRGYKKMALYTDQENKIAQACYHKCGFQIVESLVETMSNGRAVPRFIMESVLI